MNVDGEPYTLPFAYVRNRKVPIMNANGGTACVCTERVDISNAQLRSTTPIDLIPAPGANKILQMQHISFVLRLPTSQAFVGTPTVTITLGSLSQCTVTGIASALDDTVGRFIPSAAISTVVLTLATVINQPLVWALSAGLTGNANNDNTVSLYLTYVIIDV